MTEWKKKKKKSYSGCGGQRTKCVADNVLVLHCTGAEKPCVIIGLTVIGGCHRRKRGMDDGLILDQNHCTFFFFDVENDFDRFNFLEHLFG
jgi:hypothetical protein